VVGSLLLLFVALTAIWMWFSRRGHPKTKGSIQVQGLEARVEIHRNEAGIPHIYAQTEEDMYFAQGYVHAQDRFWQMEFWRRIGAGRLAELFGDEVRGTDMYLRTIGIAHIAEQEYELYEDTYRRILEAYAAGVNAYILNKKPPELGIEFALLKLMGVTFEIEPWTPVNSLTWVKVMSQNLASNMDAELINIDRIRAVGLDMASDFYIPYLDGMPYIISDEEMGYTELNRHSAAMPPLSVETEVHSMLYDTNLVGGFDSSQGLVFGKGKGIGSNNWVISGSRTSTGSPILANDIHLSVDMPSIWYEIGLHCTGEKKCTQDVYGFSFAGFPGVIAGHNGRIAWGLTTLYTDVQDLFVERVNPNNPNQYLFNGEWHDMDITSEEISVHRKDDPYRMLVRRTRHGPIVTDHGYMFDYSGFGIAPQSPFPENLQLTALSLCWTALQPGTALKSVVLINRAQNFNEFREALRYWDTPAHNFVYADVDGNIGYQAPGLTPIRARGDGQVPVPGWTDEYEWIGYIPYDDMPSVLNPEKGYIVTANNPVVSYAYPYLMEKWSGASYRAKRIIEMIETAGNDITVQDIKRMQADYTNLLPSQITPLLETISFEDEDLESARRRLLAWDADMHKDSPEAALYGYFHQSLIEKTFKDQLTEKLWPPKGPVDLLVLLLMDEPESPWWDDVTTLDIRETRDDMLVGAFEKGFMRARKELGDNFERWRWGDVFTVDFKNMTFGESGIGVIENFFNRGPFPMNGGITQVNQATWRFDEPFNITLVAASRHIVDLGDVSNSFSMHTTGQSGHPTHRHYDNLIERWLNVEYHRALWDKEDVEESSKQRLLLIPTD
jgi:penicillin amidase